MTSYLFLADGFEEIEALATVDILRRAGIDVKTVSIKETLEVEGAHGVKVRADIVYAEMEYAEAEWLILPGGMPGAANLKAHDKLCSKLLSHNAKGGRIAAICASPGVVLGQLGIMEGRNGVCYPGFEPLMRLQCTEHAGGSGRKRGYGQQSGGSYAICLDDSRNYQGRRRG